MNDKNCEDCKFGQLMQTEEPCYTCYYKTHWKPVEVSKELELLSKRSNRITLLESKLSNANNRINGLLTDRDNINKRLASLESNKGFQLRELNVRLKELESKMAVVEALYRDGKK